MKLIAALCAVLLAAAGAVASADAAKKHKRPYCNPRHTKVLKKNSAVRIIYVEHPGDDDFYGTPATVYACFPARKRRTKLFEIDGSLAWKPQRLALTKRYFAFFATTTDSVCEKYQQPNCSGSYVTRFRLSNGRERCRTSVLASALALTSNGWIAWLESGATGQPSTLTGCDSAGNRTLDRASIDPASVHAAGTSVEWTRDGQPASAVLR
jgi:hypothetical protein